MNHKKFEPQQNLAEWVKSYWTFDSTFENTPLKNTIIPDGTMKLFFHKGDGLKHYLNENESIILPKCYLLGQLTHPYIVEPLGDTSVFIVRFQPIGFLPLVNINVKEIQNKAVSLDKVFGRDKNNGSKICEQIINANSIYEKIEIFENFLIDKLSYRETIDNIVKSAIDLIFDSKGNFSVNELSKQNNINRRQLTRKFSSVVGLSPKQLSKIIRIQNTLKALVNKEVTSLTDLAYDNKYFDQSHFIKDFKAFTGLTPKEFYGNDLKVTMLFEPKY